MGSMSQIEEINMDGFQVVSSTMFSHIPRKTDATCSIWPSKIAFSKLCLTQLHNCEYIRIEVHPKKHCLLIIPVSSQDKDSLRWINGCKDFNMRNMESKRFGKMLYEAWNLDPDANYRAKGKLVTMNSKVMMLFDFSKPEIWRGKKSVTDSV